MERIKGKTTARCTRCTDYKYNAPMYMWIGLITGHKLGKVCQQCAIKEAFGSNYRNNKKYQEWLKEEGKNE